MAKKEENNEQLTPQQQKMKALMAAMQKIEKDFGKGSIMKMGDEKIENVEVIPTGSIGLNAALGVGGYPKGRIIEIYGPESSGKTTLAIHAIAECQKAVALLPSLTQSMPSTVSMPRNWASILTTSTSRSPTMVNRRWRLPTS